MIKLFVVATFVSLLTVPGAALAGDRRYKIIAIDSQSLGYVNSDAYDDEGLCNRYGIYGDKYSDKSIFNRYGDYGSQYSDLSAYNRNAKRPPVLFEGRTPIGFITKNTKIPGAIDPDILRIQACEQ